MVTSSLVKHLQRIHPKVHKSYIEKQKIADENRTKFKNKLKRAGASSNQTKLTAFQRFSPVMKLAINLAVHEGISFNKFDKEDMRALVKGAKVGLRDDSKRVISSETVKASIHELAELERSDIRKRLKGKIVNITADFATCEHRSFYGRQS
jgi:hypothetical protein